jgi:hypothetical protein
LLHINAGFSSATTRRMDLGVRPDDEYFKLCLPLPVSRRSYMPFHNHQQTRT